MIFETSRGGLVPDRVLSCIAMANHGGNCGLYLEKSLYIVLLLGIGNSAYRISLTGF